MKLMQSKCCAVAFVVATAVLAACQGDSDDKAGKKADTEAGFEVQVMYRDRRQLPPSAQVEVQLQDVSLADAAAEVIARKTVQAENGPPFNINIRYKSDDIDQRHRYSLRATITLKDQLLYSSNQHVDPFATEGPVEIMVERVSVPAPENPDPSALVSPENSVWKLERLNGNAPGKSATDEPLALRFNKQSQQVSGYSGCNRFSGQYTLTPMSAQKGSLKLGPLASTRKACVDGMDSEQQYLDALTSATAYHFEDDKLVLTADDSPVAEFSELR